jgi:hypothetical protein
MGFAWFPQVFCGFFGFLCDLGHKMGDFTGDYWRFGVCGGSGLGKRTWRKPRFAGNFGLDAYKAALLRGWEGCGISFVGEVRSSRAC